MANKSEVTGGDKVNKAVAKFGAVLVTVSVILFAIFMVTSKFGSYVVCIFLALGYIMMIAGFHNESDEDRKVPANIGIIFGCVYTVLILLVYYAQITAVRNDALNEQAVMLFYYAGNRSIWQSDVGRF